MFLNEKIVTEWEWWKWARYTLRIYQTFKAYAIFDASPKKIRHTHNIQMKVPIFVPTATSNTWPAKTKWISLKTHLIRSHFSLTVNIGRNLIRNSLPEIFEWKMMEWPIQPNNHPSVETKYGARFWCDVNYLYSCNTFNYVISKIKTECWQFSWNAENFELYEFAAQREEQKIRAIWTKCTKTSACWLWLRIFA